MPKLKAHINKAELIILNSSTGKEENNSRATDPFMAKSIIEKVGIKEAIKYIHQITGATCKYAISGSKELSIKKNCVENTI